ncbi:MAG: primosomal protein N' (replication factor Y) - superfamily II helicase [Geminicoccaceae bacterium]
MDHVQDTPLRQESGPWGSVLVGEEEPPEAGPGGPEQFPCAQCGALLKFKPGSDNVYCAYCGHDNPIVGRGGRIEELDYAAHLHLRAEKADVVSARAIQCESCGAEFSFDANVHAAQCPFCGSDTVADTGIARVIKPNGVLSFVLDERAARRALGKWLGRLWFAPSDVKRIARRPGALTGMYVPYWTYDAATRTSYLGERGTVYYVTETVTVVVNGKRQRVQKQVPKIRWRSVSGQVDRHFDDVLVLASDSLPRTYTERLEPWDLHDLRPYQPEYLSGFRAETYQVDLAQGFERAQTIMANVIRNDIRLDIGGDAQRIHRASTKHSHVTFKHVLLPIWLAAYRYRGKPYRFVINGRTGQVQGERPYSFWKIASLILFVLLIAVLFFWAAEQSGMVDDLINQGGAYLPGPSYGY